MEIFNITEKLQKDQSVEKYEFNEYSPIVGINLNNPGGEIKILIETQVLFTHPCTSYLFFDGQLVKNADDTAYAETDVITLTNNAMMHLFSNIKYKLSGHEIESLNYPGQATIMLGLLEFSDDFKKSLGLNQLWFTQQ